MGEIYPSSYPNAIVKKMFFMLLLVLAGIGQARAEEGKLQEPERPGPWRRFYAGTFGAGKAMTMEFAFLEKGSANDYSGSHK